MENTDSRMRLLHQGGAKKTILLVLLTTLLLLESSGLRPRLFEELNTERRIELPIERPVAIIPLSENVTTTPDQMKLARIKNGNQDRDILLVHVGKTGGNTIRKHLSVLRCYKQFQYMGYKSLRGVGDAKCVKNSTSLARQTRTLIHIWSDFPDAVGNATSYLVTLRNPIERAISSYRYAHIANCQPEKDVDNYGCHLLNYNRTVPGTTAYKLFVKCFPSPGIEDFAQAALPPYDTPNEHFIDTFLGEDEQCECRQHARMTAQGNPSHWAILHLQYNYKYYAEKTYYKYPEKEVFAVRTENQYDDLVALDKLLGGNGTFIEKPDLHDTHGSEGYQPSPVSTEAYQKLCCVLEDEIAIYLDTFQRALNLGLAEYEETEAMLKQKCGLSPGQTWTNWRAACRAKLEASEKC